MVTSTCEANAVYIRDTDNDMIDVIDFSTLEHYVILMRYKRSGSTLLVTLLDAHPNAVFTECRSLYREYPLDDPEYIYNRLYTGSNQFRDTTFETNGYAYPIEGRGHATNPIIIGHKSSTEQYLLMTEEEAPFSEFQKAVNLPLKYVHLIRSPYEQANARWQQKEWRRNNEPLDHIIGHIREVTEAHAKIANRVDPTMYYCIYYEDLTKDPVATMTDLCNFLGLPVVDSHLEQCKELVFQTPEEETKTCLWSPPPGEAKTWTDETREYVRSLCEEFPDFYSRYL